MSRARTLAQILGSDGALNVADLAGLAAVASSGSAADLLSGYLPAARIQDASVAAAKLASGVAASNLVGGMLTSSSWLKLALETTGTTAKVRHGSDGNGLNFTTNALYSGGWVEDDTTKKKMAYIQHLGNGRHEFRTAPTGSGISWTTSLLFDDASAYFNVPLYLSGPLGLGVFTHGSNSGEARLGRADDRSAGVATLQLGGASGQRFEIVDRAWSKILFQVADDGATTLNGNSTVTGSLTVNGGAGISGNIATRSGDLYVPAGGTLALNIESIFGVISSGLLIITGNENGVNGTIRTYSFNHTFYGYASNTRYVRIKAIDSNGLNNGYGDVYAYLPNYSGSYTSLDQSNSGGGSATSDIYFRNAVGQGCSIRWTIWRM